MISYAANETPLTGTFLAMRNTSFKKKKNLKFIKTNYSHNNYKHDRKIFNSNSFSSHIYTFKFLPVCIKEYMSYCLNSKWMMW